MGISRPSVGVRAGLAHVRASHNRSEIGEMRRWASASQRSYRRPVASGSGVGDTEKTFQFSGDDECKLCLQIRLLKVGAHPPGIGNLELW